MKKAAKNYKKVAAPRPDTDWDAIQLAVAVGQLSQAVIARSHGITPARLSQKIKEMGWPKGTLFNATIKKVKEKHIPEVIPENTGGFNDKFNTSYAREREERAIEVAAAGAIQVVRYHRSLLGRAQSVAETLLRQLETAINHRPLLEDIAIELTKGVDDSKRRSFLLGAVALNEQAGILRNLTSSLKNLVPLERTAHAIDRMEEAEEEEDIFLIVDRRGITNEPEP